MAALARLRRYRYKNRVVLVEANGVLALPGAWKDTRILGLLVDVFRNSNDEDGTFWLDNTDGRLILCYRAGIAYVGWTKDREKSAKLDSAGCMSCLVPCWYFVNT